MWIGSFIRKGTCLRNLKIWITPDHEKTLISIFRLFLQQICSLIINWKAAFSECPMESSNWSKTTINSYHGRINIHIFPTCFPTNSLFQCLFVPFNVAIKAWHNCYKFKLRQKWIKRLFSISYKRSGNNFWDPVDYSEIQSNQMRRS